MTTKAEDSYRDLRRAIVTGAIPPASPLDETRIAAHLGVGRTPLREALKRLASDGFISWPPRRTAYVREIGAQELSRLYEARLTLEVPAARIAAERITDRQMSQLEDTFGAMKQAIDSAEVYESVELDHQLHIQIAEASDNRFLVEAIRTLNCGSLRLWYVAHERIGMAGVSDTHHEFLDALRHRDPDESARVAHQHVLNSLERQLSLHAALTISPGATGPIATQQLDAL